MHLRWSVANALLLFASSHPEGQTETARMGTGRWLLCLPQLEAARSHLGTCCWAASLVHSGSSIESLRANLPDCT